MRSLFKSVNINNLFRVIEFIKKLITASHSASQHYSSNYFLIFARILYLRIRKGFGPRDSFFLGLLDPKLKNEEFLKYCSNHDLQKIQRYYNPMSWGNMIENKGLFYKFCAESNIPIPKLFALFFKSAPGWTYTGRSPENIKDWDRFFDNDVPNEFVLKPSQGLYGKHIYIFQRDNDIFKDPAGRIWNAGMFFQMMQSNKDFDSFVIQQKLRNHSEIIKLTGSESLQTIRFTTFVDSNTVCKILYRQFKIVVGDNIIDNFEFGETGNLLAEVTEEGYLKKVITINKKHPGPISIQRHPKTDFDFTNFKLPLWEEACSMIKEVAIRFTPLRLIGWDVAITPEGPVIIEANYYWDAPNWFGSMGEILSQMNISQLSKGMIIN